MPAPDELTLFAERLELLAAPYMITGATAAILYGQPRVTNDLDVVLALEDSTRPAFLRAFPETEFYVPPETVIQAEQARTQRGHFNLIHHESGYKADIYLVGADPLHAWALPRRRRINWSDSLSVSVAPPEYVILRKLEFYREGGSAKHPADIRTMLRITPVERHEIAGWVERLGLEGVWAEVR